MHQTHNKARKSLQDVRIGRHRIHTWRWPRRGLALALLLLATLDIVGVILTARPVAVEWKSVVTTGLPPGSSPSVQALALGSKEEDLFIGTGGEGVFFSDNQGQSWQPVNEGLTNQYVLALIIGLDGKELFSATEAGIFRYDDEGQAWQPANQGLTHLYVQTLAVAPVGKRIFAGTAGGGVFYSDDGQSWQSINQGLTNLDVQTLLVTPETPDRECLFAGTGGGGVFRSDDGGQNWQPVNNGLANQYVQTLETAPKPGDQRRLFAGTQKGLFYSDDGGQNWQLAHDELANLNIQALNASSSGKELCVGTFGDGILCSQDGGQSWQSTNQGLTNLAVQTLAKRPDGENLFAGTKSGIFHLDNWEPVWQPINQGLAKRDVRALTWGPDGESLFALVANNGVFRSDDGGQNWRPVNQGLQDPVTKALTTGPDGKSLFVGTASHGVFRSVDGGQTWQPTNQGLDTLLVWSLAMVPHSQIIFAGTWGSGIFYSKDNGQSWQSVIQGLFKDLFVRTLVVTPDGQNVFAGTARKGVLRSDDGGQSWQKVKDPPHLSVRALAVAPDGKSLFAGIADSSTGEGKGVFYFDVKEQDWSPVGNGQIYSDVRTLVVEPGKETLFAGTWGGGLFRSDDEGQNWYPVNEGLANRFVQTLLMASGKHNREDFLLAGTLGGVFASADGGQTWRQPENEGLIGLSIQSPVVARATQEEESLFLGTGGSGVFHSQDGGSSWEPANKGLVDLSVQTLVVTGKASDQPHLFVLTDSGSLFRSVEEGQSWQRIGEGLSNRGIQALAVARTPSSGESLFAGTRAYGVFRSDNEGEDWWPVNDGLTNLSVRSLVVTSDVQERDILFVDTDGGIFRSDNSGHSWQLIPDPDFSLSPSFGKSHITIDAGEIRLNHQGMNQLLWATSYHQVPQDIAIHKNHVTLYASTGAAVILRAEVPLPLIRHTPFAYQSLVSHTWRGIHWVEANAAPLSVGLGSTVMIVLLYVYFRVVRPNRFRFATILWLLSRPRYLFAASNYQTHVNRWIAGDSLEQLILIQAPIDTAFTASELEIKLHRLNVAFDIERLQIALSTLVQRGLLAQDEGAWQMTEPHLTQIHRRELAPHELSRLVGQTLKEHPLYIQTRRFFAQAHFHVKQLSAEEFLLTPQRQDHPQSRYGPLYMRLIIGRSPTGDDFSSVCGAAQQQLGDDLAHRVALVISDRRPEAGARYRLYEIRQAEGLAIVPLDSALFSQIRPNRGANDILAAEIDQATGQQNLYAISGPVSSDLSFFGRERILQEIVDLLDAGQPVGLFGLRKAGKTSLIQRLQGRLAGRRPIAAIDTQGTVRQQGVWPLYPAIIATFVTHLEQYRPDLTLPELRLWPSAGAISPAVATAFLQDLHALHAALGQPDTKQRVLLIVDEIDRLLPSAQEPGYAGFAALLGQLRAANQQVRLLDFIVVGVDPEITRRERWEQRDNELYRALREVWLPPMAPQDVQLMIESLGSQMGVRYEPQALDLLAQTGGGHPFVTRQLCSRAVQDRLGQGLITVTANQAKIAIEEFVFQDPCLTELWRTRLDRTQREMLRALAQASAPLPRARLLPAAHRQAALMALAALEEYTLVRRENDEYVIAWDLLRHWIRWVELGLEE